MNFIKCVFNIFCMNCLHFKELFQQAQWATAYLQLDCRHFVSGLCPQNHLKSFIPSCIETLWRNSKLKPFNPPLSPAVNIQSMGVRVSEYTFCHCHEF